MNRRFLFSLVVLVVGACGDDDVVVSVDSGVALDAQLSTDAGADSGPAFIPDELQIGDSATGYFSLEISPDMRFAVWQEIIAGGAGPVWSCGIDPLTAEFVPEDGRGFRVDGVRSTAAPQWGSDSRGVFFVTVDADGRFILVRPDSATTATVETLTVAPDTSRAYPYPTRLTSREGAQIAFLANDSSSRPQIHVVDTATPDTVRALTNGPIDFNGTAPSFVVTVFRWFPGSSELAWGFNDADGKLQVRGVDLITPDALPRTLTDEAHDHVDAFPAVIGGEQLMVGGIDSLAVGALYTRASPDAPFRIRQRIEPASRLAMPMMAASFEPFEWGGRRYASYIVLDGARQPGSVPAELWLADLDTGASVLLSSDEALHRMDPEYFLGRDEVFVIFYARRPTAAGFRIYRARTGLMR